MGSATAGLALVFESFIKERRKSFPCEFGYRLSWRLRESAEGIHCHGMDAKIERSLRPLVCR